MTQKLGVSDEIELEASFGVDRTLPLASGLSFATIPLNRPGTAPPGIPAEMHSLMEVVKDYEAVYVSSITEKITHQYLILAIAQQMGSAHEDDGVEPKLHRLNAIFFNGLQPYYRPIAFISELTLQIGERVLEHAELHEGYQRSKRRSYGNASVVFKCKRLEMFLGLQPLFAMRFPISECEFEFQLASRCIQVKVLKARRLIDESTLPFDQLNESNVFAVTYSSKMRQMRVILNGSANEPMACELGFLDTLGMHPEFHENALNQFCEVEWVTAFKLLVSPEHCLYLRELSEQQFQNEVLEREDEDAFPP